MSEIELIEQAIANLPDADIARLAAWFAEFEADRFDRRIERDAAAGKLDRLAEAALDEWRSGAVKPL